MSKSVGRNDPCPCGSEKKFKKCCENNALGGHTAKIISNEGQSSLLGRIAASGSAITESMEANLTKKVINATLPNAAPSNAQAEEIEGDLKKD